MAVSLAEDENTVGCKNPQTNKHTFITSLAQIMWTNTISPPIILSEIFDLCVQRLQNQDKLLSMSAYLPSLSETKHVLSLKCVPLCRH